MSAAFFFGLGYSAKALARRLATEGWNIAGTSRTDEGVDELRALGYVAYRFDGKEAAEGIADALAKASHVVVSASPDENGDPTLDCHAEDLARANGVRWIGYLSTIGVYGDTGGAWIDETAPVNPNSERTRRRVEAEAAWLSFGEKTGKRVQIFRLGGIYGPGRSAIDDLRAGKSRRIVKPGQVFNRTHVADIASVLAAASGGAGKHTLYNVTDNEPAPPQDVIAYAANLLGCPPPPEIPFESANLSPMAVSFYSANRRVRNSRLKDDLGVRLIYPTYREGLTAIVGLNDGPGS
jgi:nucleoside-diphosphate-sugar epimerase